MTVTVRWALNTQLTPLVSRVYTYGRERENGDGKRVIEREREREGGGKGGGIMEDIDMRTEM